MPSGTRHGGFYRRHDIRFADAFLEEITRHDFRTAMLRDGRRQAWEWSTPAADSRGLWQKGRAVSTKPYTDRQVLKRARRILDREGVIAYLGNLYEAQGFSPLDGVRKVIEHITTPTDKMPLGNPDMLKLYFSQTTEEQTKKLQIDSRTLVAHKMISEEPPKMRARVLKTANALPSGA
jgi:hypothetical protein